MPDSVFPKIPVCRAPLLDSPRFPPLAAAASLQLYLQEGGLGSFWVGLFWFMAVQKPGAGRDVPTHPQSRWLCLKQGQFSVLHYV